MTDISVQTKSYQVDDRAWLLFEAQGLVGPVPTWFGVLDFSKFTKADHYPDGYLRSGLVLGRVTSGQKLGPYLDSASDGRQTAVGHLYNAITVPTDLSRKVSAALVDCFAVVSESRLPAGHGLDAAAKADLSRIQYRA